MSVATHSAPRRRRRGQRGLTLLELIVGVFIAIFLTAAAVAFAAHETRLMGISRDKLDMSQASRAAIDLMASDIAMAGAGVGFLENGNFAGLDVGPFNVAGCAFNTSGAPNGFNPGFPPPGGAFESINLQAVGSQGTFLNGYNTTTQDILLRFADGAYSTVAFYNAAGAGQFCASPDIRYNANELAVMRTGDGLGARTVAVTTNNTVAACTFGQCVGGCVNFVFAANNAFTSGPGAAGYEYTGGELQGGFKTVVWFVATDGAVGTLRRAVFDAVNPVCGGRNNNLGGAVAEQVETVQVQVYQFITDPAVFGAAPIWVNMGQNPLSSRFRTRVDLEVVIRSRTSTDRQRMPVNLRLRANACLPAVGACNQPQDFAEREAFRTSVEIKNASL